MPATPSASRAGAARLALLPVLALAACVSGPAGPRPPIVTDRPDFTESAEPVPRGALQVEGGVTLVEDDDVRATSVGELLVRAWLAPRVELRIGLPTFATASAPRRDDKGFEDVSLGLKLGLHAPAEGASRLVPAVGLIVGSTLPTGTGGFGAGGAQPEAKLLLAWTVTDRVGLASNLNWARVREPEPGDTYDELSASLSLGVGLTETVGAYLETYAFAPRVDGAPRPAYVDRGLAWQLSPDFQLDARVGVGVHDAVDSRFVGVGFARRF